MRVGLCYLQGTGVRSDPESGLRFLKRAARMGHAKSLDVMGLLWDMGGMPERGLNEDQRKVLMDYGRVAESGCQGSLLNLGCAYYAGKGVQIDGVEAHRWLSHAARDGNSQARTLLGKLLLSGANGIDQNPSSAISHFKEAVQLGNAEAMYCLACCYMRGIGVPRDGNEAVKLLEEAAEQGNTKAAAELGMVAAQSDDLNKALPYLELAAESGEHPEALYRLAQMHELGLDGAPDREKALGIFEKGADMGYAACAIASSRIRTHLGAAQRAATQFAWQTPLDRHGERDRCKPGDGTRSSPAEPGAAAPSLASGRKTCPSQRRVVLVPDGTSRGSAQHDRLPGTPGTQDRALSSVQEENKRLLQELDALRDAAGDSSELACAMDKIVQKFWLRLIALEDQLRLLGQDPDVDGDPATVIGLGGRPTAQQPHVVGGKDAAGLARSFRTDSCSDGAYG